MSTDFRFERQQRRTHVERQQRRYVFVQVRSERGGKTHVTGKQDGDILSKMYINNKNCYRFSYVEFFFFSGGGVIYN